jgi:O-antigen/teichoic acid export membrane protein
MFIVAGLLLMINGMLPPPLNVYEGIAIALGLVVSLLVYSYLVWRTAPDKVPPAGTSPAA